MEDKATDLVDEVLRADLPLVKGSRDTKQNFGRGPGRFSPPASHFKKLIA